jgi:hypothetical protein
VVAVSFFVDIQDESCDLGSLMPDI